MEERAKTVPVTFHSEDAEEALKKKREVTEAGGYVWEFRRSSQRAVQ